MKKKLVVDIRKEILELIKTSTDDKLPPVLLHTASMRYVSFSEVMDIVLYYLSLQADIGEIGAGVKWRDFFWDDIKGLWNEKRENYFDFVREWPWANNPGPCGGTMGSAEHYMVIFPSLFNWTIKAYFLWPEVLAKEDTRSNWPKYKKYIEGIIFPKFRRNWHAKKLELILVFAEEVYGVLKSKKSIKKKRS